MENKTFYVLVGIALVGFAALYLNSRREAVVQPPMDQSTWEAKMREQLAQWQLEMAELQRQAGEQAGKEKVAQMLDALKQRGRDFEESLRSGARRTGKAWEAVRVQGEASWADLKRGLKDATKALRE
eukprot:m51a1_g12308 hypothetical protein (127) ;mRNA; r:382224-382736